MKLKQISQVRKNLIYFFSNGWVEEIDREIDFG